MASFATGEALDFEFFLDAARGFLEGNFEIVAQIAAALLAAFLTTASATAEKFFEAAAERGTEHLLEDVPRVVESTTAETAASATTTERGMTEAIVSGALVGI